MDIYKIVIVDDEPSILSSLKRIIEKDERYKIIGEAFSVNQALIKIKELLPDIIFTDIKMPGDNGIVLLKNIVDSNMEILSVVLSGYDNFEYVHDAFIYGAEEYLLKPIEPLKVQKLLDKIALKLEKRSELAKLPSDNDDDLDKSVEVYKSSAEKIVEDIDNYLKANLCLDNSIIAICRKFAISQPYLSKIIKKSKNMTYNEYLISLKVSQAKQLLKQRKDMLIADIAEQTGFSDQFYFSRVFKNVTGTTPTEFRQVWYKSITHSIKPLIRFEIYSL